MRRYLLPLLLVAFVVSAIPAGAADPIVVTNSHGRIVQQELPEQTSWPYPGEIGFWGKLFMLSNGDHDEFIEFRDGVTPTDVERSGSGVGGLAVNGRNLHLWTENGRSFSISTQSQSPENYGTLGTTRLTVHSAPGQTRTPISVTDAYLEFPTASSTGPTIASRPDGSLVLTAPGGAGTLRIDADGYVRLPVRSALDPKACDANSETGRVTIVAGRQYVCAGKGGWR